MMEYHLIRYQIIIKLFILLSEKYEYGKYEIDSIIVFDNIFSFLSNFRDTLIKIKNINQKCTQKIIKNHTKVVYINENLAVSVFLFMKMEVEKEVIYDLQHQEYII